MPTDDLAALVGKVQQRVGTLPDYHLIVDAITNKYRDIQSRIPWSWRRKQGEFYYYAPITTGTVTLTRGYNIATFSSAVISSAIIGQQLRAGGNNTPIRTITRMIDSTHAELDRAWAAASQAAVRFEIYAAYCTVPEDFDAFISIVDLTRGFQLNHWAHSADELDARDPYRAYSGNIAYWMVLKDYSSDRRGIVGAVIQSRGTGPQPISAGEYTGPSDALFTIEITAADTFKWKKDGGAYTTGVLMDGAGDPQGLQDGVLITFPVTAYTIGDVLAIPCRAAEAPGSPRYEAWPHIKAEEVRPYLYLAKLPDLTDEGAMLPRYVRGDAILEMVLADIARWKHPDNGYYDLKLALVHDGRAEQIILDMMREDQAKENTDLTYTGWTDMPAYDSDFLVGHDVGFEMDTL